MPAVTDETGPAAPQRLVYADDLVEGTIIDLGIYTVTHEEIVEFASRWDPQRIHVDDEWARTGFFGEIIASGIHSFAIYQRLAVLGAYRNWAIIAGRTVRDIQLPSPVRAGTTLRATLVVGAVQLLRPDRAIVTNEGRLDDGDTRVFTVTTDAWVRRRPGPHS
jgi:acyl dehydratase